MMSEKGRENFKNQLQQVVSSIQYTNDMSVQTTRGPLFADLGTVGPAEHAVGTHHRVPASVRGPDGPEVFTSACKRAAVVASQSYAFGSGHCVAEVHGLPLVGNSHFL